MFCIRNDLTYILFGLIDECVKFTNSCVCVAGGPVPTLIALTTSTRGLPIITENYHCYIYANRSP